MHRLYRLAFVFAVILCSAAIDQITKRIAHENLANSPAVFILGGTVELVYTENPGAILGLGSSLPASARFWIFAVFVGLVLILTILFAIFERSLTLAQLIGLSLVSGGGIGNLIDRLLFEGQVRDFMLLKAGPLHTGIFNAADVFIFAGIFLLLLTTAAAPAKKT